MIALFIWEAGKGFTSCGMAGGQPIGCLFIEMKIKIELSKVQMPMRRNPGDDVLSTWMAVRGDDVRKECQPCHATAIVWC